MTLDELLDLLFPPSGPVRPTPEQDAILRHPQGPGWVLAGPGSGKTEVLTLLVLRLLFVEGDPVQQARVPPEAILITTFTEKAARNLEDRISSYRSRLVAQRPELAAVDISKLRLGTLHGLCNDLLQEHRAPNYQNVRLMDELETSMFVYEHRFLGLEALARVLRSRPSPRSSNDEPSPPPMAHLPAIDPPDNDAERVVVA